MIPLIGIMIGLYIVLRLCEMFQSGKPLMRAACIIVIAAQICAMANLTIASYQAYEVTKKAQKAIETSAQDKKFIDDAQKILNEVGAK